MGSEAEDSVNRGGPEALHEEMADVELNSEGDAINVWIDDVKRWGDDRIKICYEHAGNGQQMAQIEEKPDSVNPDRFKWVRILDHQGYRLSNYYEHLVGNPDNTLHAAYHDDSDKWYLCDGTNCPLSDDYVEGGTNEDVKMSPVGDNEWSSGSSLESLSDFVDRSIELGEWGEQYVHHIAFILLHPFCFHVYMRRAKRSSEEAGNDLWETVTVWGALYLFVTVIWLAVVL